MSDQDKLKPYHARDASRGQEAADAVADVLQHAKEREQASQRKTAPKASPRWMLPVSINLGVLAVYFLVAPPQWVELNPMQLPPAEEQIESLRTAMYFNGIARIETFLANNGRLPTSLEEAGGAALVGSVEYVVRGNSYALVASVGDEVIAYDSATMTQDDFTGAIILPG